MATNTTNYNLKKPASDEFYNVADQNDNMDIIDTQLKQNADDIEANSTNLAMLQEKVTTHLDNVAHVSGRLYAYKNIGGAF